MALRGGCNSSCVRGNPEHYGEPEYTGIEQGALLQAGLHLDPTVGRADWRLINCPFPFAPAFVHYTTLRACLRVSVAR